MPAVRTEGLYFTGSPWESFPGEDVQSTIMPLRHLASRADEGTEQHSILMAFPIIAYEIVNDTVVSTDETPFMLLYRHAPLLASRLLQVATEYVARPPREWDMRRALLEFSNTFCWIEHPERSKTTFRLLDFEQLQKLIHERCPQHLAVTAELIRTQHYYNLHREMKELWTRWFPQINTSLTILPGHRKAWLERAAPVVRAAGVR